MYEYIAQIERWKNFNTDYTNKYNKLKEFVITCESKCTNQDCHELCKKPIIDIEKFSTDLIKKSTLDIYELCNHKTREINELTIKISKTKKCIELLYQDNENLIKKEMLNRLDDLLKYLTS
jgi:hypothetical protein